jgi:cytochrome oxidase Cu insertion factor (SCO1/SenC/PrrC family)
MSFSQPSGRRVGTRALLAVAAVVAVGLGLSLSSRGKGGGNSGSELREGALAPAVSLPATTGDTVDLAQLRGKRNVLLYFYEHAG